ncbi:NADAR family protein [Streptomyces sp. NPDC060027]|uniref:NADAR family protein n=1 Tax=Streptomyces sp. NPDC060027 TaxID=3347040 RepID=UPI003678A5C7
MSSEESDAVAVSGEPDWEASLRKWRRAAVASAGSRDFVMFWKPLPEFNGGIGAGCLSQWWPSPFTVDGIEYVTAEHWMMAGKARLFGDEHAHAEVLATRDPRAAMKAGRRVRGFEEPFWRRERWPLVVAGNVAKFRQNPDLCTYLASTASRILVEASPQDRTWGIGLAADDDRAATPALWQGLNLLGFALMEARRQLTVGNKLGYAGQDA